MSVAHPLDALRRSSPRADAPDRAPGLTKHWKRGQTLARDEALRLVAKVYGLPEHDPALAHARLTSLALAGWLVRSEWTHRCADWLAWTRAEADPPLPGEVEQPAPRVEFHTFGETRPVFADVVTADGRTVRVQIGTEEVPPAHVDRATGQPVRHQGPTPTF